MQPQHSGKLPAGGRREPCQQRDSIERTEKLDAAFEQAKLTVTIPVYNMERYLTQCMDSVIHQTYKNLEIIAVDDGSTDRSYDMLQDYAARDSRVKIIHKANGGLISAREVAIEQATGEYITFCDPDDWVDLDFYGQLVEALEQNQADVAIGHFVLEFDNHTEVLPHIDKPCVMDRRAVFRYLLAQETNGALWDKVYRTNLIKGIRLPQFVTCAEDIMRNWYIFQQRAQRFAYVPVLGYHYRHRADSMTKVINRVDYPHTQTCVLDMLDKDAPLHDEALSEAFWQRRMQLLIKDTYKMMHSTLRQTNERHTRAMQRTIRQNLRRIVTCRQMPLYYRVMALIMALPYTLCLGVSGTITLVWAAKRRVQALTSHAGKAQAVQTAERKVTGVTWISEIRQSNCTFGGGSCKRPKD